MGETVEDPLHHINYKEGLVALSSLKRTARVDSLAHSTKLTLRDNLCVVLAFEKGRSNSPSINRLCRIAASLQVGLDIHWRLRHIESPRNVADAPSRWFEKSRRPEQWWIDFAPSSKSPSDPKCSILSIEKALGGSHDLSNNHPPPGLENLDESKMQKNPDSLLGRHNLSSENSDKTASSHKAFLEVWENGPQQVFPELAKKLVFQETSWGQMFGGAKGGI